LAYLRDVCVQAPPVPDEIILLCVRCYCKYGINYRNLQEILKG
jgi:transposase-like protein